MFVEELALPEKWNTLRRSKYMSYHLQNGSKSNELVAPSEKNGKQIS
jgi:hypothetical protein